MNTVSRVYAHTYAVIAVVFGLAPMWVMYVLEPKAWKEVFENVGLVTAFPVYVAALAVTYIPGLLPLIKDRPWARFVCAAGLAIASTLFVAFFGKLSENELATTALGSLYFAASVHLVAAVAASAAKK